jgi:hypothetical protein
LAPSRETVIRVERGTRGFCKCVSWDFKTSTQAPEDECRCSKENCGGATGTVGEGQEGKMTRAATGGAQRSAVQGDAQAEPQFLSVPGKGLLKTPKYQTQRSADRIRCMAKFKPGDRVMKHGDWRTYTVLEILPPGVETLYLLQQGSDSITVKESLLELVSQPTRAAIKGPRGLKRTGGKSQSRRKITRNKAARKAGPRKR